MYDCCLYRMKHCVSAFICVISIFFRMAYFPFDVPKDCSSTSRVDSHTVILPYNLSSNPEFFVACGVLSFMFCCAAVAVYVFRTALYQTNQTIPILVRRAEHRDTKFAKFVCTLRYILTDGTVYTRS